MGSDFFGVYLLYSLNDKFRGRIYIGFTVNPSRRISQHNKGSKFGGAKRTNNRGPWEMLLIVGGFPNDISALRFEWAWQNPLQSRRLNSLPRRKSKESLLQYHLRLLDAMISAPPWVRLPLQIHWLNTDILTDLTGFLTCIPSHVEILQGSVESSFAQIHQPQEDSSCRLCQRKLKGVDLSSCYHDRCNFIAHLTCLASYLLKDSDLILPVHGCCPSCSQTISWGKLVKANIACDV